MSSRIGPMLPWDLPVMTISVGQGGDDGRGKLVRTRKTSRNHHGTM